MSDMPHAQFIRAQDQYGAYRPEDYADYGDGPGAPGSGWIAFAAVMMTLTGGLYVIAGFVSLLQSRYYGVTTSALAIDQSWTTRGWTQLIIGALVAGAGFSLARGRLWARILAIVLAGLTVIDNFLTIGASPVWNLLLIGLALMVIFACIVHGREATT